MLSQKDLDHSRTERIRGYIVYLLYTSHPAPLELQALIDLLDARNFPLTRRRLAKEIDYLRSLRLLRVFPMHAEQELDEVAQAKLVQRYADSESDSELRMVVGARLTTAGMNFQEGVDDLKGLYRVE